MTVLFGSYATSSTRAPTHASQNTEESLNRLFDDNVTKVKNQMGDKLVGDKLFSATQKTVLVITTICDPCTME